MHNYKNGDRISFVKNNSVGIVLKEGEGNMPQYTIRCTVCGTVRQIAQNTGFQCRGCGASISVGNDGEIRKLTPKKKGK